MVCEEKRTEVAEILNGISKEKQVRILYACESGSRAWGFASQDSDYDVRFVYAHSRDWYLSVNSESKKDVIDLPINDLMDVGGWDLRKALRLMLKSNSPLLEWLDSPIVYHAESGFVAEMQRFAKLAFTPVASAYHYLSMAKKNAEIIFADEQVKLKKYFYLLRPLLCTLWIERFGTPAPTEFAKMLLPALIPDHCQHEVAKLLEIKADSTEADRVERNSILDDFVSAELNRIDLDSFGHGEKVPMDELDLFFRSWLQ